MEEAFHFPAAWNITAALCSTKLEPRPPSAAVGFGESCTMEGAFHFPAAHEHNCSRLSPEAKVQLWRSSLTLLCFTSYSSAVDCG